MLTRIELPDDEALVDGVLEAMRGRFAQSGRRRRYGRPADDGYVVGVLSGRQPRAYP